MQYVDLAKGKLPLPQAFHAHRVIWVTEQPPNRVVGAKKAFSFKKTQSGFVRHRCSITFNLMLDT